ncbi:hypothetical protein [Micromonospora sp. NPDC047074]|uniref:hypothetical protein n=1 Tax=Micromonospora sp. NPDC047074 TaxID=3154339 RepID=UPI0033D2B248
MVMLSREAFARARGFVFRHGRPLDRARFGHRFESRPASEVVAELARFQNPDGGFGHALEPDLRAAASSAIATSMAFAVLREVDAPATDPVVRRGVAYLLETYDGERSVWRIVPPEVEDAPHAPWWTYTGVDQTFDGCRVNPTADLLGVLHDYAELVPPGLLARLTATVLDRLEEAAADDLNAFRCAVTLAAARRLPEATRGRLAEVLAAGVHRVVNLDPAAWPTYVLQPLEAAPSPRSTLAGVIDRAAIDTNLDYWIHGQQADGAWPLTWSWAEVDESAWRQAERDGKGLQIVERLTVLHAYGRL